MWDSWLNDHIGFITCIAIIIAPIVALQIQKWTEKRDEQLKRKMEIFKILLSTRNLGIVSQKQVEAFNLIDIEFHNVEKIRNAWNGYRSHLYVLPSEKDCTRELWHQRAQDLLIELLYLLSQHLGYKFDKNLLRQGAYYPKGIGDIESQKRIILDELVNILLNKKNLRVEVIEKDTPKEVGSNDVSEKK